MIEFLLGMIAIWLFNKLVMKHASDHTRTTLDWGTRLIGITVLAVLFGHFLRICLIELIEVLLWQ